MSSFPRIACLKLSEIKELFKDNKDKHELKIHSKSTKKDILDQLEKLYEVKGDTYVRRQPSAETPEPEAKIPKKRAPKFRHPHHGHTIDAETGEVLPKAAKKAKLPEDPPAQEQAQESQATDETKPAPVAEKNNIHILSEKKPTVACKLPPKLPNASSCALPKPCTPFVQKEEVKGAGKENLFLRLFVPGKGYTRR